MFWSVILCIVVALLAVTVVALRKPEGSGNYALAVCLGVVIGVVNYFTPKLMSPWLAGLFVAIMIAYYVYLVWWWLDDDASWREAGLFVLLAVMPFFTMKATVMALAANWDSAFWTSLVSKIPMLILVATIGYFVIDALYLISKGKMGAAKEIFRWLGRAAIVLTTLLLIVTLTKVNWKAFSWPARVSADAEITQTEPPAEEPKEDTKEEPEKPWSAFYNLALTTDEDPENDYNFGYNPRDFYPDWEKAEDAAKLFDADMRKRMSGTEKKGADVALGAANMAWLDANVGTRYLGEFYESCKEDWAKTMNEAKVSFMKNQGLYKETLEAFFKYLDHAVKVEVKDAADMDDQMYMNPYTFDHVPDIVVFKTKDHTGKFLVYTFNIKGELVEVAYRIDCGYQPTNVEKVMKITPTTKPTDDKPTGGGDKPTGGGDKPTPPSGGGDKPTPPSGGGDKPTPPGGGDKPTDGNGKKDPKEGTQGDLVKPNDDPGPGPDTNNGKGAKESTEDLPTNSNHHESYSEYKEDVEELKEVNESQKTDEDSNEPSTKPKKTDPVETPVTVDNNGDKGTNGKDGIDVPTPVVTPRAEDAETGKPITNNPSNPAGEWEGPPD